MYYTESRGKEKDIAENQSGFYIIILIPIDIETVRFTTTPVYEYCHSSSLRYILHYVGIIVGSCTILGIKLCIL